MAGLNRELELRGRAQESKRQKEARYFAQHGRLPRESFLPGLPPAWDAFFQALEDRGVTKLADQSVGEARGMFPHTPPRRGLGFDPSFQRSAVLEGGPSNQLNAQNPALAALEQATGTGRRYQSHEQWMRGRK